MDDMNAFERQVAGRLQHQAGPTSPVDDLAVFEAVVAASRQKEWGFTMFSALKFVAASAIVALAGGFLITGILNTHQGGEILPGAMAESPSPTAQDASAFPTGALVSVENPNLLLTFNEDGTGKAQDAWMGWQASFIYATHNDLYTEMWSDADIEAPVTYHWDFDGEHLTLSLWAQDLDSLRNSTYADNTWTRVEDPLAVAVASRDIEIGDPVYAIRAFVPATEVGPGVFTSTQDVFERVATVPIGKGQPITPDMLEPPA